MIDLVRQYLIPFTVSLGLLCFRDFRRAVICAPTPFGTKLAQAPDGVWVCVCVYIASRYRAPEFRLLLHPEN